MEFEPGYYDVLVQHISNYTTGIPLSFTILDFFWQDNIFPVKFVLSNTFW